MTARTGLVVDELGVRRCFWAAGAADYRAYHDEEWGQPVADDQRLFEKICLEGFQAGLSWLTILRKRAYFREVFANFDFHGLARFNRSSVGRLLEDRRIVRHRGKIESVINNAKRARELEGECGSLGAYFWRFEPPAHERPRRLTRAALVRMSRTPTSVRLSDDLKRRGWTFVGPTTCYAFMQAMGLVNDHIEGCAIRPRVEDARRRFEKPL